MDVTNVEAVWSLRNLRSNLCLVSAHTMLAFVVCHLTAHGFLLISFERADRWLGSHFHMLGVASTVDIQAEYL